MIILNKVTVQNAHNCWDWFSKPKGAEQIEFDFKPGINVVIGHNGAGKSTLVKSIREYMFGKSKPDGMHLDYDKSEDKEMVYFFLAEDNNPSINLSKVSPAEDGFVRKTAYWMGRKELSSGMNTNTMLKDSEKLSKEASLVFFDEPEQALDAKALLNLKKMIKRISKESQVVIVTHHPALILMKGVNVIEMNPEKSYFDDVKSLVADLSSSL